MSDWISMTRAPKNGREIILKIQNYSTGDFHAVVGCWMAPNGDQSLLGWWSAGAATGSRSYCGLPFKYEACVVSPRAWMEKPIASVNP